MPILALWALAGFVSGAVGEGTDLPDRYTETIVTKGSESITFEMVLIPGGTFLMGSPPEEPGRRDDEGPQFQVTLAPFYLCTTETTLELFLAYYGEANSGQTHIYPAGAAMPGGVDALSGPTPVYGDITMGRSDQHPAIGMTWRNAVAFSRWLSKKTGKEYRLPTEAEWEYACRAGRSGSSGTAGDAETLEEFAWFSSNSAMKPHEVGGKRANPWGLFDMLGNVGEWVYDFYSAESYQQTGREPLLNPTGPEKGRVHVARGGYYQSSQANLRCAARDYEKRWWRSGDPQLPKSRWWLPSMDHIGFRVARSASELRNE